MVADNDSTIIFNNPFNTNGSKGVLHGTFAHAHEGAKIEFRGGGTIRGTQRVQETFLVQRFGGNSGSITATGMDIDLLRGSLARDQILLSYYTGGTINLKNTTAKVRAITAQPLFGLQTHAFRGYPNGPAILNLDNSAVELGSTGVVLNAVGVSTTVNMTDGSVLKAFNPATPRSLAAVESNPTAMTPGILTVNATDSTLTGHVLVEQPVGGVGANHATIDLDGTTTWDGDLEVQAGSGAEVNVKGTATWTGATQGPSVIDVALQGSGKWVVNGVSTGVDSLKFDGGTLEADVDNLSFSGGIGVSANGGTINNNTYDMSVSGALTGTGTLNKIGSGQLTQSGDSSTFAGSITVSEGSLVVNGTIGGSMTVEGGGTLAGPNGSVGATTVRSSGILVGEDGAKLTFNGGLALDSGAIVNVTLASPSTDALFDVKGNLTLDGTLNIKDAGGLSPGHYRLFDYTGTLTDNTLDIGTVPPNITNRNDLSVQAAQGKADLVNSGGVTLNYWKGGSGTWNLANTNWTNGVPGTIDGRWDNGHFAIFQNTPNGVVQVDDGGTIAVSGMQFAIDGYRIEGDPITLQTPQTIIRTGTGPHGPDVTATIASQLIGSGELIKSDHGTLVLSGDNRYTGGTSINDGTLSVSSDSNLGHQSGGLTLGGGTANGVGGTLKNTAAITMERDVTLGDDGGTFETDGDLTLKGSVTGAGTLTKEGAHNLILTGDTSAYSGSVTVSAGELHVGNGSTGGTLGGTRSVSHSNGTSLVFNRSGTLTYNGEIRGAGSVTVQGGLELTLTGDNSYEGATKIGANSALVVNGDQGRARGDSTVNGMLRGSGIIGGNVTVNGGGNITAQDEAGSGVSKLTIRGGLTLADPTAALNYVYDVSPAGSPDALMIDVSGPIALGNATLNVTGTEASTLDPGIHGLLETRDSVTGTFGTTNIPSDFEVQYTQQEVNLVNSNTPPTGTWTFWDGLQTVANNRVDGGPGTWQASGGTANWTDKDGSSNGGFTDKSFAHFMNRGGTVRVDTSEGAIDAAGMQFAGDEYRLMGGVITLWPSPTEVGGSNQSLIRVGKSTPNSADMTAVIESQLVDAPGRTIELVKGDLGTLVLSGDNTYSGGTLIKGGTLSVSADNHLGAAQGALTVNGGTLQVTGTNFTSTSRTINWGANGGGFDIAQAANTFTLSSTQTLSGTGGLTKTGAGTLELTGVNTYTGTTTVTGGTLAAGVANAFSSASDFIIQTGGTLDLNGYDQTLASLKNAGTVGLGGDTPGTTLTVNGDYTGNGGTLDIASRLKGDTSTTDRLVVKGSTSGTSVLAVKNVGGQGAKTTEGIKIVDVDGDSNGTFTLRGDYVYQGDQAVVGGAYAYRLYQNAPDAQDGDWYLRSGLKHPSPPPCRDCPLPPHYQPGAPVYEAYGQALLEFNAVGTMRERLGNRIWRDDPDTTTAATPASMIGEPATDVASSTGFQLRPGTVWGRIEAAHGSFEPRHATSSMDYSTDIWKLQAGIDGQLYETGTGQLLGGVFAQYGTVSTDVTSPHGHGSIDTKGYGLGGTLTWFGTDGIYVDGLAQATWYDSDLSSSTASRDLVKGNNGFGYSLSLEAGKAFALTPNWALTPQAQLVYSAVDFDDFTDPFDARISLDKAESLKGRAGLAADYRTAWRDENGQAASAHVYGTANLNYEMLDGAAAIDLAGTDFATENDRLWGGVALGGTYSWADNKYALHAEAALDTSLENFADSYAVSGNVGLKVRW